MKGGIVQAVVLALVALIPAWIAATFHPDLAHRDRAGLEPDEVRLEEVRAWTSPILWVDARGREAYDAGHIPGAVCLDPAQFDRDLGDILMAWSPEQRVIVYCSTHTCATSREIAGQLRTAGLEGVHYLRGGWEAWNQALQ